MKALSILNSILSLGGVLDGYKTIVGGFLMFLATIAATFPQFAPINTSIVSAVQHVGDILFSLGIVHWKIKDLLGKE